MSARKFLVPVLFVFMISLMGCATPPQKRGETGLEEIGELPAVTEREIVYPKAPKEARLTSLKEKIKEYLPAKKTPAPQKIAQAQEKPRPRHVAPAKDIQTALKNAGYYTGNIDGKIGSKTGSAIEAFQKDNSLKVDGVVGQRTWNLLSKYLSSPSQVSLTPAPVTITQAPVSTETTVPTMEQVSTPAVEETAVTEETPSVVEETTVPGRNFRPLIVIALIVLGIILTVSIYRRRHT